MVEKRPREFWLDVYSGGPLVGEVYDRKHFDDLIHVVEAAALKTAEEKIRAYEDTIVDLLEKYDRQKPKPPSAVCFRISLKKAREVLEKWK